MQPLTRRSWLLRRAMAPLVAGFVVVLVASDASSNWGWLEHPLQWLHSTQRQTSPHVGVPAPPAMPITVTPQRPVGNDSSVSKITLPLILVRTQLGRNNHEGFAQIGVNAQSPQTYSAGALLANGARLTEIYTHYVVLEHEGHSVRLYLQGEPQPDAEKGEGLMTVGGAAPSASRSTRSQETLTAYIRPSPVFVESRLRGYALYPGRNPSSFSTLGLQPGDVVTEINGSPISGSSDSLAALRTLSEGGALTVVIDRQGNTQTLSLDGAALARATTTEPARAAASYASYKNDFKAALHRMTGRIEP